MIRRGFLALAMLFPIGSLAWASGPKAAAAAEADAHSPSGLIGSIVKRAMVDDHLKSLLIVVRSRGRVIYSNALGESMTGVPVTLNMHFRNGAMAFSYMATLLMELVDRKKVTLDTKLSKYLPDLPHANEITLKNLANMTSGYADYVYQPEVSNGVVVDPFRQWTPEQLIKIGTSKPIQFAPGTNWGYSHTNYVILGRVLEKITGMPLDRALRAYVFAPLAMRDTQGFNTPVIPEPAVHSFSSERRETLGIKPGVAFYEESTYWNPSWTTAEGAVETTSIDDMNRSWQAIGRGTLLSKASHEAMTGSKLIGFGHTDPKCPACRPMTTGLNYGLSTVNIGAWVTQTKNFYGAGATAAYLPLRDLTITVATTLLPAAFDAKGNYPTPSTGIVIRIANALAPNTFPAPPPKK